MTHTHHGLSQSEVADRQKLEGFNEIPSGESRSLLRIMISALREPMILLLSSCALIYFLMGEGKDGALLVFSVGIVLALTLYQEWKSERAVEALRDLSSPRALVIREGVETRIAGREVVSGDLLVVSEGDRIAADAVLVDSSLLKVDESLLTGESFPTTKEPVQEGADLLEAKDESRLFAGTLAVAGRGLAQVIAIGPLTQMGRIGQSLQAKKSEDQTLLQKELGQLVRTYGFLGVGFSLLITVIYGFTRGDWPQGVLAGLSTAMSLLPEEFPVILTVFLAMGAWRISKARVLTRRLSATESLGSITVLCVDKTGTLTKNLMEVRALDCNGEIQSLAADSAPQLAPSFRLISELAALASHPEPFDPMEKAIHTLFKSQNNPDSNNSPQGVLVREYPFSRNLLAMTCVWKSRDSTQLNVATKGAPEAILDLCSGSAPNRAQILERVQHLANNGLRVLAVARATHQEGDALPEDPRAYPFEFAGLLGLEDPIRPEVPEALSQCYSAGIRVIMMTGDFSGTAQSIARQIGFTNPAEILTGSELTDLSDEALRKKVRSVNVFARMVPEQKLRVIHALKANSEIVAMTGDGVNDAPSLKWADVGIAMGGRGTDVAREAASIVLLDDNFASIVTAIRLGRRIFDNIRKAMAFIFAVHVPIAGMAILPVLLRTPLVLLPAHIVFLELVIDPACALLFEGEPDEPNIMNRPPRALGKPLFGLSEILHNTLQGAIAMLAVASTYAYAMLQHQPESKVRAAAFSSLVLANLGLILVNRSRSMGLLSILRVKNRTFFWLVLLTLLLLALVLYWPNAQSIFKFQALDALTLAVCFTAAIVSVVFNQGLRTFWQSRESIA